MENFNPDIRIVAVDQDDVVVTFDSATQSDAARSPKVLRLSRNFAELTIMVNEFTSPGESGDIKEYHGTINLVVKLASGDEVTHVLATPVLWIEAESRNRKKGASPFNFFQPAAVTRSVRKGVANALTQALAAFYAKESHIDILVRTPEQRMLSQAEASPVAAAGYIASAVQSFVGSAPAANDDQAGKRHFRNRVIIAALVTPLLVYGLLWVGGAVVKKNDPIQDAVAKAMSHDPRSMQAQVELTRATLKQMGLDPGKSGDVGCLAPQ